MKTEDIMTLKSGRCEATCWKGAPDKKAMIDNARCKKVTGHNGWHQDKNGNTFTGSGLQSEVVVVRGKKKTEADA